MARGLVDVLGLMASDGWITAGDEGPSDLNNFFCFCFDYYLVDKLFQEVQEYIILKIILKERMIIN